VRRGLALRCTAWECRRISVTVHHPRRLFIGKIRSRTSVASVSLSLANVGCERGPQSWVTRRLCRPHIQYDCRGSSGTGSSSSPKPSH
jgi:hypothetical protein